MSSPTLSSGEFSQHMTTRFSTRNWGRRLSHVEAQALGILIQGKYVELLKGHNDLSNLFNSIWTQIQTIITAPDRQKTAKENFLRGGHRARVSTVQQSDDLPEKRVVWNNIYRK